MDINDFKKLIEIYSEDYDGYIITYAEHDEVGLAGDEEFFEANKEKFKEINAFWSEENNGICMFV